MTAGGGTMIVYGRNPVREAIRGPRTVRRVWATRNASRDAFLAGDRVSVASAEEIERLCGSREHQGVCAEVSHFAYTPPDVLTEREGVVVVLDQVQDPQNLGAICRSAECAGAAGVVIAHRHSAQVTAAVCKASAGAVEHLAIARVRNVTDFLSDAKRAGAWCYGAAMAGSLAYDEVDYGERVVLVLGSEGRGLRPRVAAACDALVAIPIRGRIESLSVSAAAALLIFAAARPQLRGDALTAHRQPVSLPPRNDQLEL